MNQKKEFTVQWFDGRIPYFNSFLSKKDLNNSWVLEIGSYEGKSTCYLMDYHRPHRLVAIDIWDKVLEHSGTDMLLVESRFDSNTKEYGEKIIKEKGNSFNILTKYNSIYTEPIFDFIYIDGGHTMQHVMTDFILSFPLAKPGAIIAFDDYQWGSEKDSFQLPDHQRPEFGINACLFAYKDQINILHGDSAQVWIEKNIGLV